MKMHNTYGYGQLFCFSGLDGETSRRDDFVGMLMENPISIRFHFESTVTLNLPIENPEFYAVTGDILDGKDFFVAVSDRRTVVGKSLVKPSVTTENEAEISGEGEFKEIVTDFGGKFYLATKRVGETYYFTFSYGVKNDKILTDSELDGIKSKYRSTYAISSRKTK